MRAALIAFASLVASPASALDVELDSDTSFQAYEVRAPGVGALMARRRLLSVLGARVTQRLGEADAEGRVVRLSVEARLRIDQDFGETCLVDRALCIAATDASEPATWQPLAADTRVDAPTLHAEVTGLALGLSARLGRQLVLDAIGFARFDGLELAIAPHHAIRVSTYGGWLVRATTIGGSDRSDPQGSLRLDVDPSRVPWAAPPAETWVVGAAVEGGAAPWLRGRIALRHAWEPGGQVISRVSLSASSVPLSILRIEATGVLDLLTTEVIDAHAALALGDEELGLRASVDRRVPRFDPGTIWAFFAAAPIGELRLAGHWRISPWLDVSLGLRGRRAELGQLAQGEDLDAGADGALRARIEGFRVDASGFVFSGSLGPLAGAELAVTRRFFDYLELAAIVTLWHFDDPLRQDSFGTVLSELLSARFRISPEASLYGELSHATSRTIGHRFRGIVALRIDTWR